MKKSTRLLRKLVALVLVLLLSIESFGAVLSDNDGYSFITKAEFDSLKNDFQRKIDQYNTSIDSKIDGAIASYLAGIRIAKTQELKPEFSGRNLLVTNLDKIDNLKFGKMDFKISAAMINMLKNIIESDWDQDWGGSSGAGIVLLERIATDGKHGKGFEVFRNTRANLCRYYDDMRFEWTAFKFNAAKQSSGSSMPGDSIDLRWHGCYGGKQRSSGTTNIYNAAGDYFSDILANDTWLGLHQSAGIGITTTSWITSRGDGLLDYYQTFVSSYDLGDKYIISTNGTNGLSSNVKEDLYLVISDKPLNDTLKASDYLNEDLGTHIANYKVNGVSTDKACAVLSAGNIVKIDIEITSGTNIYYKIVPVNSNSKARNVVIMSNIIKFESTF